MAIKDLIKKAKDNINAGASEVLSGFASTRASMTARGTRNQLTDLQTVRKAKGVQDKGDESDPLFRIRANKSNLETTMMMKADAERKKMTKKPASGGDYETEYAKRMSGSPTRFNK